MNTTKPASYVKVIEALHEITPEKENGELVMDLQKHNKKAGSTIDMLFRYSRLGVPDMEAGKNKSIRTHDPQL